MKLRQSKVTRPTVMETIILELRSVMDQKTADGKMLMARYNISQASLLARSRQLQASEEKFNHFYLKHRFIYTVYRSLLQTKNRELSELEKSEFTLQGNLEETQHSLQNAETIISAQKREIQKLNNELTEVSTSFAYKALCALPGIVKTGVKFTGTTVVAVEISGRLGLHRYRPITSSCKKVKGGVKKIYGKVRSKKKEQIPSDFHPPVLAGSYHSTVGVDLIVPPIVSPVSSDVDM